MVGNELKLERQQPGLSAHTIKYSKGGSSPGHRNWDPPVRSKRAGVSSSETHLTQLNKYHGGRLHGYALSEQVSKASHRSRGS